MSTDLTCRLCSQSIARASDGDGQVYGWCPRCETRTTQLEAFRAAEARRRAYLEEPYYKLQAQSQGKPPGAQADLFGAAGLDRIQSRGKDGGGTLL